MTFSCRSGISPDALVNEDGGCGEPPKCLTPGLLSDRFTAMGTFFVGSLVANHTDQKRVARIPKLLVDTGSEYTWLPEATLERIGVVKEKTDLSFVMANGSVITRNVGFAIIRVGKYFTIDEVVFAEKGDLTLLGARTLEGLNLVVDSSRKRLVAAGPIPAASSRTT